ncbi:MAG: YtxH domain-containing protein [Terriglobia bacterium]
MQVKSTGFGFLTGLGVGVVLGLLYAPQSGKKTQELITKKTQSGLDKFSAAGKRIRAQAVNFTDKASERISDAVEAGREGYREQKTRA